MAQNRYFISSTRNFPGNVQVDSGYPMVQVFSEGNLVKLLGIGDGVTEEEYSPGLYRYVINNYEIGFTNTAEELELQWFAYDGGSPVATYPFIETVDIDTQVA